MSATSGPEIKLPDLSKGKVPMSKRETPMIAKPGSL